MAWKRNRWVILIIVCSIASAMIGYYGTYAIANYSCNDQVPASQSLSQLVQAADTVIVAEITKENDFGPQEEVFFKVCSQSMTITYTIRVREVIRGDQRNVNVSRQLIAKECFEGPNELAQNRLLVGNNYLLFLDRKGSRPIFPMSRYAFPVAQSVPPYSRESSNSEAFRIAS